MAFTALVTRFATALEETGVVEGGRQEVPTTMWHHHLFHKSKWVVRRVWARCWCTAEHSAWPGFIIQALPSWQTNGPHFLLAI